MRGTARQVIVTTVELEDQEEHEALSALLSHVRDGGQQHTKSEQQTAQSMLEAMDEAAHAAQLLRGPFG